MGASAVFVSVLVRYVGFDDTFRLWQVPGYGFPFLDAAVITGSAASYARGFDPSVTNPGDPLGRLFNYPKIWYVLFRLPLSHALDVPIGLTIVSVFLIAVLVLPRKATFLSETLLFLALVSPVAMLGYSRANVDLLIFGAMVIALALLDRYAVSALGVVLVAFLFKIFPVMGLGCFLDLRRGRGLQLISVGLLLAVSYAALISGELPMILKNTPNEYEESYGIGVLPGLLSRLASASDSIERAANPNPVLHLLSNLLVRFPFAPFVLAMLLLTAVAFLGIRNRSASLALDRRDLRAFWMGSGIYIGTFLIGNNFDYRLLFLLLALPQLGSWMAQEHERTRRFSILTVVLVFAALWKPILKGFVGSTGPENAKWLIATGAAANWILFACLVFLFASSIPNRIFREARLFLCRCRLLLRRPVAPS